MSLRGWLGTPVLVLPIQLLVQPLATVPLDAQQLASAEGAPPPPTAHATSYDGVFDKLLRLRPMADRVAEVSNLVLQRDVARFSLQSGHLYLLSPVNGRTVAAVFRGKGSFAFAPGAAVEKDRLKRFENADALEAPFTELMLVFADGTLEELERTVKFGPGALPGEVQGIAGQSLKFLAEEDSRTFEPDLMGAFLNGERSDLFYAHIKRASGGPLMFMLNPNEFEAVRLHSKISRRGYDRRSEVITQFPVRNRRRDARISGERLRQADIQSYVMDVSLPPTGIGEIGFSATATMEIVADTVVGPWVVFELFEKLKVDSASWEGGVQATVVRGRTARSSGCCSTVRSSRATSAP